MYLVTIEPTPVMFVLTWQLLDSFNVFCSFLVSTIVGFLFEVESYKTLLVCFNVICTTITDCGFFVLQPHCLSYRVLHTRFRCGQFRPLLRVWFHTKAAWFLKWTKPICCHFFAQSLRIFQKWRRSTFVGLRPSGGQEGSINVIGLGEKGVFGHLSFLGLTSFYSFWLCWSERIKSGKPLGRPRPLNDPHLGIFCSRSCSLMTLGITFITIDEITHLSDHKCLQATSATASTVQP